MYDLVGIFLSVGGLVILVCTIISVYTERYIRDCVDESSPEELWDIHNDPL